MLTKYIIFQRAAPFFPFRRVGEASHPGPSTDLGSFNGNCWSTAREWLKLGLCTIGFIQEHKRLEGEKFDKMKAEANKDGWRLYATPAVRSELGEPMGGTAVAAPAKIAATTIKIHWVDEFTIVPGRASGVMLDHWLKHMVLCVSLYLKVGVGMNGENWATM